MAEPPDKFAWVGHLLRPIGSGAIYVIGGVTLLIAVAIVFGLDDLLELLGVVARSEMSYEQKLMYTIVVFAGVVMVLFGSIAAALCAMKKAVDWSPK